MVTNREQHSAPTAKTNQVANKQIEKPNHDTVELSPRDIEARAEEARIEALRSTSTEVGDKKTNYRRGSINDKQRTLSYTKTLKQVQSELPLNDRLFSKIIHTKMIERVSDLLGSTIARPNAVLSGAFFAFILTLLAYLTAKTIGYALSGSETIAAFILGWVIGIVYDYLHLLFTGRNN